MYHMTPNHGFPHQFVGGRIKFSLASMGLCFSSLNMSKIEALLYDHVISPIRNMVINSIYVFFLL